MTGEMLHQFDLDLSKYVLQAVGICMSRPAFAKFIEDTFDPAILAYLIALRHETDEPKLLLLSEDTLLDIASAFEGSEVFNLQWEVDARVHRRSVNCTREIREVLAQQQADEWGRASAKFAAQLESRGMLMSNGIHVILAWVEELRRLLLAMGATAYLPHPEGSFPTPQYSEPPAPPAPPSREIISVQHGPPSDGAVLAAISEVRDLLVSQRTVKDWYTTEEVAHLLSKSNYTVRQWCLEGRIHANKKGSGRGKYQSWVVSHVELERIQKEGLLPVKH